MDSEKKMPPVVNEMEQRCTHWCKHWWRHPVGVAATTVSLEGFSCCFFQFFSTCGISFFFLFFFNSPDLFQILMVLRLACYYLQLQNKGRLFNSVLRGRAKLFWEGCLPNAWVADLKGCVWGGIMLGAEGWESTHCGSFYVVEFIFLQLKETEASLVEWTH